MTSQTTSRTWVLGGSLNRETLQVSGRRKRDRQAGKHAGSEREGEEGQGDRERRSKCI